MTKNIYIYILTTFLGIGLSACGSFLDTPSIRQESDTNQLTTAKGTEQVLLAAYGIMASENLLGKNLPLVGELLADNLNVSKLNGTNFSPFINKNFLSTTAVSQQIWDNAYQAIFLANTVVAAVDNNKFAEAQQLGQQYKGEALWIRACLFFELTKYFAQPYTNNPATDLGIMLRVTPTPKSPVEAATKVDRSTVQQSYEQIIKDLTLAIALLPDRNGNRITKMAAKAMLTRVYFTMTKYAEAYTLADELIKANTVTWKLSEPFTSVGDNPTNGVIFQLVNTPTQDNSAEFKKMYFNDNKENILLTVSNDLLSYLRNNTSRAGNRWSIFFATDATAPYTTKFNKGVATTNLPYLRWAEIYLIRAEAGLQAKKLDVFAARKDMNVLRRIAEGIEDNAIANEEILLEFIQEERRVELVFEGDRYQDLRRLRKPIRGLVFNDKAHLLKIPMSELNANPNIIQN